MTEADWQTTVDLWAMLMQLRRRASARKLRLFACACVRRVEHLLTNERSLRAVEASERIADGLAGGEELPELLSGWPFVPGADRAALLTLRNHRPWTAVLRAWQVAGQVVSAVWADAPRDEGGRARRLARDHERRRQCDLLRDVFGNPFRPVLVEPSWLRWNSGCVPRLARAIYQDRAFRDLAVLADALTEAGCTREDVLTHCRTAGDHVRGCWVVDLLAGFA
jgi:hypothetical protein